EASSSRRLPALPRGGIAVGVTGQRVIPMSEVFVRPLQPVSLVWPRWPAGGARSGHHRAGRHRNGRGKEGQACDTQRAAVPCLFAVCWPRWQPLLWPAPPRPPWPITAAVGVVGVVAPGAVAPRPRPRRPPT